LGTTSGGFFQNGAAATYTVPTYLRVAAVGDFNADGHADILWRYDNGAITDWLGSTSGTFVGNDSNAYNSVGNDWQVVGVGDFNGDGRDDILWRRSDGIISDWLGTASGGFVDNAANALTSVDPAWHVAAIGDFNGDHRKDILWRHNDGRMSDWLGATNGGWVDNAAHSLTSVGTDWHIVGAGDFNGDGRDDIFWRNDDGRMSDWLGTVNGGFTDNCSYACTSVPTQWRIAVIGDFNGDGRDDIVWRDTSGTVSDWLGAATGGFIDNAGNAYSGVPTYWQIEPSKSGVAK
jgi:hypothetical protein